MATDLLERPILWLYGLIWFLIRGMNPFRRRSLRVLPYLHHMHCTPLSFAGMGLVLSASVLMVENAAAAAAIAATPLTQVGDTVTNPATGVNSKVVQLIADPNGVTDYVLTDSGAIILTKTVVGNTIQPLGGTAVYKVISVVNNATTGLPQTTNIRLSTLPTTDPTTAQAVLVSDTPANYTAFLAAAGTAGAGAVTPPTSTSGIINEVSVGAGGSNGSNAYGITIPVIGTIGKAGSPGGNGADGPTVNRIVLASHGDITSTAANTPGIMIGSVGGNGGKGGDSYGNIAAYSGGNAGNGGSVTVNNATNVSTGGDKSHGVFVFSRSGTGGAGGKGYIFASGGSGGAARNGGPVALTNSGKIETSGTESHGLYALSVGGAAGSGGNSWGIVGQGGSGSNGGNGGTVSVTNSGDIHTTGASSHGILAQSVGGTGGNGGSAGGIVAFGGSASNGGTGGDVTILNQTGADITTTGKNSIGILGQSIGGSGGDSGAAGGIVALGASGGTGNNAGTVTITNQTGTAISTEGENSHAVFGQSVGGGGGNTAPTGGAVAIGGTASGGGNGSTVTITSAASLFTVGRNSHGIFAQSIGGGGGSAGGTGGLLALGASGGAGGNGGALILNNSGVIHTSGTGSHAIFGQSIGGGGGAGGDAGGAVSIGGTSSSGGTGSTVNITNSGGLLTDSKDSRGIFAQSIGGGGGAGGGSGGIVSLGGSGSAGSAADAVTVTNLAAGSIVTKGVGSDAIFAQSIGGGGGAGAASGGLVALGGSGTGGGAGGTVTVSNAGILSTTSDLARGIFAQSIGGGGGSGGSSGGLVAIGGSGSNTSNAAAVSVTNTGKITTLGNKSTAIFAQSIGGGGGDGGSSSGVITIGGSGGAGGSAGDVTVSHSGEIDTAGHDALGIFAQAVGGGGGNGGAAYSGGLFAGFALGGSGASGGDGKQATVNLNNTSANVRSTISTTGDRSTGILAQSVGGGGGNGGNAIQSTVGVGVSLSVAIGGSAATGGEGGVVNLTGPGDVTTTGANAAAIILQSVGGGGGNGGTTVSSAGTVGDGLAIGVAIGGTGGGGGNGGIVTATNVNSSIDTDGAFSTGFLAQSVGGGGGNGGTTIAASASVGAVGAGAVSVGIGGSGATGGTGGHVDVTLGGSVITRDTQSDGIVIQSVGGGGGNGGLTIAAAAAVGGLGAGNITVGVGGSAGAGNIGGRVDATITSDVDTQNDGSDGVIIQSIGGGGGNSGLTVSAGGSAAGIGSGGINIGVGGNSGNGGSGGVVDASYDGDLITRGNNSTGLLVQSVGGGGGNSSGTIAAALNGAGAGSGSLSIGIGGKGGLAGNGGNAETSVLLSTSGTVTTIGNNSSAIVVQSIGGGGGNGGYSVSGSLAGAGVGAGAVSVGVGGGAGSGGDGKGVHVRLGSTIETQGEDSLGVLIQSVGGGGGNGGFNVSASGSGAGVGSGGIAVGLGGSGGAGGIGGNIDAGSTGTILTLEDRSSGLVAQSIGGGGGNGGFNVSGSGSGAGVGSGAISVGLGGNGGTGNDAGDVTLATSGNVETHGNQASGILAQSLGGGGGNGGFNVSAAASGGGTGSGAISFGLGGSGGAGGVGKKVTLTVNNDVLTMGNQSNAVTAQSIGGGGGNGGFNASVAASGAGVGSGAISVGLGGSGAGGGDGGIVSVKVTGKLDTILDDSAGILAQSIGGGGGNGGFNISASGSGAGVGSGGISVGLGGSGALGGLGGQVTAISTKTIETRGDRSFGLLAQSIGGGGGNGGYNVAATASGGGVGSGSISVGLGGTGGAGNHAGLVTVSTSGNVFTNGVQSSGIAGQSIGGGGGNGGFNVSGAISGAGVGSGAISVGLGGSGGAGGNGGEVSVTVANNVFTGDSQSNGVVAQSIGGGGGNGGFNGTGSGSGAGVGSGAINVGIGGNGAGGGQGGKVTGSVTGNVQTLGNQSRGILAQSIGGGGGNGGMNVTASASGAGVGSGGIAVGLGGGSAAGGNSGQVKLTTVGNVTTSGEKSQGVVVQSIGGGGGNAAMSIDLAGSGGGTGSGALGISVGGNGGAGGFSGRVDSDVTGIISTALGFSDGYVVQSIGGGGGNAALTIAGAGSGGGVGSGAVSISVGGTGGTGGDSNIVKAAFDGTLTTLGNNSVGMLVQAIGGGGGNGGGVIAAGGSGAGTGSGAVSVAIGGNGGAAGVGGLSTEEQAVTATASGMIATEGDFSGGVVAQSIGGGGGNGGYTISANGSGAGTGSGAVSLGLGGAGAGGGAGKGVETDISANVFTFGADSIGILSQSIGGGGGNGGFNVSAVGSAAGTGSGGVAIGLGGSGGGGGDAGFVHASSSGFISTKSDRSSGFVAQSIGGGGGNGGYNVSAAISGAGTGSGTVSVGLGGSGAGGGNGGSVIASTLKDIQTQGNSSHGILAQSIGGGGGNGGFNVSASGSGAGTGSGAAAVGLGGSGAGGGNGSTVKLTVVNDVFTSGKDSSGIIAQSVGGGGGNGAFDVSVAGSGGGTGSGAVSVSLGGNAGTGGTGAKVESSVTGNVTTAGENSNGVVVQSLGGGGGNGGFSVSAAITGAGTGSGALGVGIGGTGGDGGSAGKVISSLTGNVTTGGVNARGIIAQSIGGGGGNGGLSVAGAVSAAGTGSGSVSVGLGGSGGGGGDSETVNNTVTGNVSTAKSGSGGVLAQSLGGGGGNGAINVSGAISLAGTGSGAVSVGLGGSGGDGGSAMKVTNSVSGTVYTVGKESSGVTAQSLGGGGGNGGMNITGAISAAKTGSGSIGIGIGGAGGGGGNAGEVDNAVSGYVQTQGDNSTGILAQSLGGGGGNGGMNITGTFSAAKTGSGTLAVGVGGFGGDGGEGLAVVNTVTGGTITTGNNSNGIVAQSLGGGGGNGAMNISGAINLSKENGGAVAVGVGGFGGGGGSAQSVTSTVQTTRAHDLIGTSGDNSSAVVAQSIGGGGGNGGTNITGVVNITGKNGAAIGVGVGGFGGGAGNAGKVTLDVSGDIITDGNNSHGLLAQSIGGGGGNGGTNITGSLAITAASGGKGKTVATSIGIGGFGGEGGDAGDVDVSYTGLLRALPRTLIPGTSDYENKYGEGSHGIVAQSIGGGGGNGGINVSAGISYAHGKGDGYGIIVGFGGFGGGGGDAGNVDVNVTGDKAIFAEGNGRSAIFAQSVGGGGGNGALNVSGGIVSDSPLILGVGGFGGKAGAANDVTVTAATDLFASSFEHNNVNAAGILAQSISGGGGNGGMNISGGLALSKEKDVPSLTIGVGGFGGEGQDSGKVTVDHTGNIVTSGDWIHGIMAQSIAGGGGNGGMNVSGQVNFADSDNSGGKTDLTVVAGIGGNGGKGANAGNVSVTQNGFVTTDGDNARGVAAQSIGGGGGTGGMNIGGVFAKNSSPIIVGVGGSGSDGGNAGSASVFRGSKSNSTGKITTNGGGSYGIEASSIGGGGGDAGMNFNVGVTLAGKDGTAAGFASNFAIGGAGGEAGNGAAARVNNYSDIETKKDGSHGIISQSIGGGGGNANFNIAVTYAGSSGGGALYNKPNKNMGFNLAIGGATGDGGFGGTSDVIQVGNIETFGKDSYGILSQSIGGGGGNAGMDVAFIKADGGKAGITIGRTGGLGGYASDVSISSNGSITTHGDHSYGMLAQSVGNGGGNSSSTTVAGEIPSEADDKGEVKPHAIGLSIGLEGGIGGHAGNVDIDATGMVSTSGKNAHAIFAQSVGGGGGNGGSANTFGITAATASMSLGGVGGLGGYGGIVDVRSSARVRTTGEESIGILAQSIGGGGGNGGMASSGGTKNGDSGISVSIGGGGGKGMTGGLVTVANSGVIITTGVGSHGVLAQSLGGGGGNGGMAITSVLKASTEDSTRAALSIGGNGGEGAAGGKVVITNTGGVGTSQENAIGLFAQSIGGGGGNGRSVINNSVAGTSGNNFSINLGGTGGKGATGGSVTVNNKITSDPNSGKIITLGNYSHGIAAMSIGGGGGNGSTVVSVNRAGISKKASSAGNLSFSLGGSGGEGGTGGHVDVLNEGSITTYGFKSHGILAQSIGGGGGNGGSTYSGDFAFGSDKAPASGKVGIFSIGGFGGDGNRSGDVVVTNSGSIEVFGDKADGIYAQSVGGGGGDGGFAMALSRNSLKNPKTNLAASLMTFALGGFGGTGADSGNVTVNHTGSIISHGNNSYGIFAQSVGGGGGNAAHSISSPAWTAANLALDAVLGGGSSGKAGTVTINTTGSITMLGNNSTAQLGQSVNGGGGNVDLFLDVSKHAVAIGDDGIELPDNSGDVDKVRAFVKSNIKLGSDLVSGAVGSAIEATHVGDLYTQGKNSIASLMQTIGGGGGNAASEVVVDSQAHVDLELALGGTNSTGNSGGDLTATRTGNVSTKGSQSSAVSAQSIGGGGGNLAVNVQQIPAPAGTSNGPKGPTDSTLTGIKKLPTLITSTALLGANGASGSNGGNIHLAYAGNVSTAGARSYGLIVQSIGGGGGKLNLTGSDKLKLALGGVNGASGNGGDISLTNQGSILTLGRVSHGMILQSIGGGGGVAFTDLSSKAIALTLNKTNSGNGGDIALTQTKNVSVLGNRSIGILAQTVGGGGGIVDSKFAGTAGGAGDSGSIAINIQGNVQTGGVKNIGVFAQSLATATQGNINIQLASDRMIYSGVKGIGVEFSGGAKNTFVNHGTVVGADGLLGQSAIGGTGDEKIVSNGLFVGQVDLGRGANKFVNRPTGVLVTGPNFLLGNFKNQVINQGVLIPGDMQNVQRTDITGSFTQTSSGITLTELDFASNRIDQFYMNGTASLSGGIDVSLLNPQLAPSGHSQKVLFSADRGVIDAGMKLLTAPSVVLNYRLLYPNKTTAVLDYNVDFSVSGSLGINLQEVGDYLNRIQSEGSSSALSDTIIKLLYDPTLKAYKESLSMLSPDFYGEQQAEMVRGSQRFEQTMAEGGIYRYVAKDKMLWFNYDNIDTLHRAYDDYKSTRLHADNFSLGLEQVLQDDWTLGAAVSLASNEASGYDNRWNSTGNSQYFGAIVKRRFGATEITGTVSYGWNQSDTTRVGQVTTPYRTHIGRDIETLESMLRVSHSFERCGFYLNPMLDLGVTYLMPQFATETGAGATSLVLYDSSETHFWVRPAISVGDIAHIGRGMKLHTHIEAGYQKYFGSEHTDIVAGFSGAPSGVAPMNVPVELGALFQISAGIDLIAPNDVSLGIEYSKILDTHYDVDRVSVKVNIPF